MEESDVSFISFHETHEQELPECVRYDSSSSTEREK